MSTPGKQASVDQERGDRHPLLTLLLAAAEGCFPPIDGTVKFLPPLHSSRSAIVSFTGHAVLATPLTRQDLAPYRLDGYGAALQPAVLMRLAGADGQVGVWTSPWSPAGGPGPPPAPRRPGRPPPCPARARPAGAHSRRRTRLIPGPGPGRAHRTLDRDRACAARQRRRTDPAQRRADPHPGRRAVFAAVSPGNTAPCGPFLASGFTPVASEILIDPPQPLTPHQGRHRQAPGSRPVMTRDRLPQTQRTLRREALASRSSQLRRHAPAGCGRSPGSQRVRKVAARDCFPARG